MIRSLLTAEITGADIPASLRSLTEQGITLLCTVFQNDLTVRVTLQLSDYGKFLKIWSFSFCPVSCPLIYLL